jgi:hypothetical protein
MRIHAICMCSFLLLIIRLPAQQTEGLFLEKIHEPNEKAFTILKPKGWLVEGGIVRWDPNNSGGAANAIEAKIDFALKMNASDFLRQALLPYLHKGAENLNILLSKELREVEKLCYDMDMMKEMGCQYSSALLDYIYDENGRRYKERAICILQDMGPYTAGMWKNRSTIVVRTPEASFDRWEPIFHEIGASVQLNPDWIIGELQGQKQRGNTMIQTMQDIARIGEEIQKGHVETNAKIHHQAYLVLTDQEDYINPYTQEVETGTNQWDYRWVDDLGNVLYTDNEEYNPNLDIELNMDGFKRSRVKR